VWRCAFDVAVLALPYYTAKGHNVTFYGTRLNPDFAASLTIFIYIYNQAVFIRVNPRPISRHSKGYIVTLLSI
jgi:hypothetical protein